ncbi:hypothetical protein BJ508DRAFT_119520 [Ascobolus immersus RN42]|uniref:Uncharacterized protein n=1 Tax=Ascobolus immersus RN42 TaxID=1160509 RepID=A0A3N4IR67_ASCIM|nr:hypothetical protein BJ508DRAFT_119520 [Ascobolus immersus RN42]
MEKSINKSNSKLALPLHPEKKKKKKKKKNPNINIKNNEASTVISRDQKNILPPSNFAACISPDIRISVPSHKNHKEQERNNENV